MAIEKDLLDQLLAGRNPKDVFNKDGLVDELKRALSEQILNTELDEMVVDGRRDIEAVGVTFTPIFNYPIDWGGPYDLGSELITSRSGCDADRSYLLFNRRACTA